MRHTNKFQFNSIRSFKFSLDALRRQTIFWSNVWGTEWTITCRLLSSVLQDHLNWASANVHSVSYLLHINSTIVQDYFLQHDSFLHMQTANDGRPDGGSTLQLLFFLTKNTAFHNLTKAFDSTSSPQTTVIQLCNICGWTFFGIKNSITVW